MHFMALYQSLLFLSTPDFALRCNGSCALADGKIARAFFWGRSVFMLVNRREVWASANESTPADILSQG
jgi:hypothetical protein